MQVQANRSIIGTCAHECVGVVASTVTALQAAAITNGIHQLLLNCVADTHALLALKAFQPTQPASAPKMAQVARTDHKQARTAARAVRAAAKAARSESVGMHTISASGEYPHGLHTSGDKLKALVAFSGRGQSNGQECPKLFLVILLLHQSALRVCT